MANDKVITTQALIDSGGDRMSTAAWIICGFGGAYLGLIAAIGISLGVVIWKEKRAEKKRKKVKII